MKKMGGVYKISDGDNFLFRVERIGAFIVRKKNDIDDSPKEVVINTTEINEIRLLELLKKI